MVKKKKNTLNKNKDIIKTLLVFLCYFIYSSLVNNILSFFGITNTTIISFVADVIFLIGIVITYKDNLKKDLKDLKKNYKISKIIKTVLLWVGVIFVFNIVMGILTEIIFPNAASVQDGNTQMVFELGNIKLGYTLFKTMFFAIVAEELLFRESLSKIIKNSWLFIFITSIIYAFVNIAYSLETSNLLAFDFFTFFLPALIFSYAYVKNNRNIFILMLIKFTYQLIPLTILLLGL